MDLRPREIETEIFQPVSIVLDECGRERAQDSWTIVRRACGFEKDPAVLQLAFSNRGSHQGVAVRKIVIDRWLGYSECVCHLIERKVRQRRLRKKAACNCDDFRSRSVAADCDPSRLHPSLVGSC